MKGHKLYKNILTSPTKEGLEALLAENPELVGNNVDLTRLLDELNAHPYVNLTPYMDLGIYVKLGSILEDEIIALVDPETNKDLSDVMAKYILVGAIEVIRSSDTPNKTSKTSLLKKVLKVGAIIAAPTVIGYGLYRYLKRDNEDIVIA